MKRKNKKYENEMKRKYGAYFWVRYEMKSESVLLLFQNVNIADIPEIKSICLHTHHAS